MNVQQFPKRRKSKYRASFLSKMQKQQIKKYQTFFSQINQQKQSQLLSKIINYHGKNVPISYKPQYHFAQQWENKQNNDVLDPQNLLQLLGPAYICYQIFTMVMCVVAIWMISVERYFNTRQLSFYGPVYQILISLNFLDILIRSYLKYRQTSNCIQLQQLLTVFYKNFILIAYFLIMLTFPLEHFLFSIGQICIIFLLYRRASETYDYIRLLDFGLQYQSYIKIFDLLLNICIQAHIFALVFYSASKLDPQQNWVKDIGIQNENYIVKYVNSIYFACTTMLTIGYGDISPKSIPQKIITIFIQIIGVIAFGYLLNQMGHTLSKMREKKQIIERDMQTISKISKYYNLDRKLQNKARNFILNNQSNNDELKIQDEKKLLLKLNQDLRQEINLENSLNIVKSSIFYLCHWSKNFQSQIAQRLQKRVFAPNEKLLSNNEKDKIYVIKRGKVTISINKYGSDQQHKKVLKIIDTAKKAHLPVSDNIYGYTSVFSNRPVKLQAQAKQFTSTYSVTKDDIEYAISQNKQDYEYYHQIKSRIDQSSICQQFEAPAIKNIRQHYCPSHILVLKKYQKELQAQKNSRTDFIRNKKLKTGLISNYYNVNRYLADDIDPKNEKTIIFERIQKPFSSASQIRQSSIDQNCFPTMNSIDKSVQLANYRINLVSKHLQEPDHKKIISDNFETQKQYKNFFNRNNISNVLYQMQKQNCYQNKYAKQKNNLLEVLGFQ